MSALPKQFYTLEEYFDLELSTNERFEYFDGEIYSMAGVNDNHDKIERNLNGHLFNKLRGRGCRNFLANMRIKVPTLPPYRYGDASGLCGSPVFEKMGGVDALTNPQVIFEILSESTEKFDRDFKFKNYKSIESFREYILIRQNAPFVSHFIKQNERFWLQTEYDELSEMVEIKTFDVQISLAEIYEDVEFIVDKNPYIERI